MLAMETLQGVLCSTILFYNWTPMSNTTNVVCETRTLKLDNLNSFTWPFVAKEFPVATQQLSSLKGIGQYKSKYAKGIGEYNRKCAKEIGQYKSKCAKGIVTVYLLSGSILYNTTVTV